MTSEALFSRCWARRGSGQVPGPRESRGPPQRRIVNRALAHWQCEFGISVLSALSSTHDRVQPVLVLTTRTQRRTPSAQFLAPVSRGSTALGRPATAGVRRARVADTPPLQVARCGPIAARTRLLGATRPVARQSAAVPSSPSHPIPSTHTLRAIARARMAAG